MRAGRAWQWNRQGVVDDIHVGERSRSRSGRAAADTIARRRPGVDVELGYSSATIVVSPSAASGASFGTSGEVVVRPDAAERPRQLARVRLAAARDPRHEGKERKPDPRQAAGLAGRGDHAAEYTLLIRP